MHLTPDQLNSMFTKTATTEEHALWTDHILDCPACARSFKAFHALDCEMRPTARVHVPLRYALGVAAVMFMCLYPYLTESQEPGKSHRLAQASNPAVITLESPEVGSVDAPVTFDVLQQVDQLNYKHALASWGQGSSVSKLVALSNKRNN